MKKPIANPTTGPKELELWRHLLEALPSFKATVYFSMLLSLLALSPSIYMLEVYDRVVTSRSEMTLLMITIVVIAAYIFQELLELVRKDIMQQAAKKFDEQMVDRVFRAIHKGSLLKIPSVNLRFLSDLKELKSFMHSPALMALIDAPLAMIFLAIIFVIDYHLGFFAVFGVLVQIILMWVNHRKVHPAFNEAQAAAGLSQNYAVMNLKNAQVIESMGMSQGISQEWQKKQYEFLSKQAFASDYGGGISAVSRFIQQTQGSAILGFGCWLAVNGQDPHIGGVIILISILAGKGLQPMVQLVGSWKTVVDARSSYFRLKGLLAGIPESSDTMALPTPKGLVMVENVVSGAPGSNVPILRGLNLQIPAGSFLSIAGPSGSGKSTLARILVGVWPASSGKVRLDGVDIYQWDKEELGPHIGYLPQEIELFDGSIAENIARFGELDLAAVQEAVALVGLTEMIESLPEKYDTQIGEDGGTFSGGQRQRIGLARALYKNPRLIVLDEPNSSLDQAGDAALINALRVMKSRQSTIVVISHRTNVINESDLLLILTEGTTRAYGPRADVLKALEEANRKASTPAVAAPAAPQAGEAS